MEVSGSTVLVDEVPRGQRRRREGVKRAVVIDVAEERGRCSRSLRELEESIESTETIVCRSSDRAVARTLEDHSSARSLRRAERASKKVSRS